VDKAKLYRTILKPQKIGRAKRTPDWGNNRQTIAFFYDSAIARPDSVWRQPRKVQGQFHLREAVADSTPGSWTPVHKNRNLPPAFANACPNRLHHEKFTK
jgi:hypothetical protein